MKFTKVSTDYALNGVYTEYDDGLGNILEVKIARSFGNPHYEAKLQKLMEPHRKKMRQGKEMNPETAKRIMNKVLASEILLDWKENPNFVDDDGKPVKYSVEVAEELLEDDPDLRDFVTEFSENQANFLMQKPSAKK